MPPSTGTAYTHDLTPIELAESRWKSTRLVMTPPLRITPVLSATGQYIEAEDADLGIHVIAETRDALLGELHEQIGVLWAEYARARDEELSPAALALKKRLLEIIREA